VANRIAGDEVRRQLADDGGDHHIEICDLIMQFSRRCAGEVHARLKM
jgi:hypothetical protein